MKDAKKTKRQLIGELADLRQRVAELEAGAAASESTANLETIVKLAMQLGNPPPDVELFVFIAQTFHDLTGALATSFSSYDAETRELTIRHVATSGGILDRANKILGRNLIGMRMPVSPETLDEMRATTVRVQHSLSETTFGTVPKPIAVALQKALGIGHFMGLALLDGDSLIGTSVIVLPKGQPLLSTPLLQAFAHYAALAIKRRQAEEALQVTARQWHTTFNAINDCITLMNIKGEILRCNDAMVEFLGKPRDEIVEQSCWKLMHGDSKPIENCPVVRTLQSSRRETTELPLGDQFFEVTTDPIFNEAGDLIQIAHIISDLTDRKEAQKALRESETRYRTISDLTSDFAYSLHIDENGDLTFEWITAAFAHITGLDPQDVNLPQDFVHVVHEDDLEAVLQGLQATLAGETTETEFRLISKNGTIRWLRTRGRPEWDKAHQRVVRILGAAQDITARKRAEERLRYLKEFNEGLIQNMAEALIVIDHKGYLSFANPAITDLLGYAPEEVVGQHWEIFVPVDQHAIVEEAGRRREQSERIGHYELELTHRDGQRVSVMVSATARYDKTTQRLVDTMVVFTNITARRQIEKELRASEERYRTLMQNIPIGVYRTTPGSEGSFLMANPAFLSMFGLDSMDELKHHTAVDFYRNAKDRITFSEHLLDRECVTGVELRLKKRDGTPIWGSVTAQVVRAPDTKEAIYFDCTIEDITVRKQTEAERERLLAAEREQRVLAETLREVSLALTSQTEPTAVLDQVLLQARRIVPYNTAHIMLLEGDTLRSARWHGYQDAQSERYFAELTQYLEDLPLDAQAIENREPRVVADTRQEPNWVQFEETAWVRSHLTLPIYLHDRVLGLLRLDGDTPGQFSLKDAQHLAPLISAVAIALENARLYDKVQSYAVEMAARVAERTRELSEAYEQLKELDRMKSKFVTDVSHELRTPVANIKLYLHLLAETTPEKREKFLKTLDEQTDRLAGLIETIMDLSQLDTGAAQLEFKSVNMNQAAGKIVETNQSRAEAKDLSLIFDPDPDLPPVRADLSQLDRVIANLLDNAINYTSDGKITVSTFLDETRGKACLQVTDTGRGIHPQDLAHIFDRFYRGQDIGSSNIPGSGLGLAIVKEIVESHNGEVKVESRVQEGTTITVRLPLATHRTTEEE